MVFSFYRLVSKDARTDEGGLSFSSGSAYRLELGGTQPQTMYFMQSRPAFNDINCQLFEREREKMASLGHVCLGCDFNHCRTSFSSPSRVDNDPLSFFF